MTQPPQQGKGDPGDTEFMTTLAKGLAVLGAFGRQRPTMTLSEAAQVADLSRATARRVLRTLTQLGYVEQDGRTFSLAPRILDLGFAYLSTQSWIDRAPPLMRELSERLGKSCSAAILQGNDIVYVARVPARRIMSAALSVGSRLPALHTALGRIMFGYLDEAEIWRRLMSQRIEAYTPQTITDVQALFDRIRADRAQRFPSSMKSSSAACARSPWPCSIGADRRLAPSICRRTRRERRAMKCVSTFSPSSTALPSRSPR